MSSDNNDALAALAAALESEPDIKEHSGTKRTLSKNSKPYALFSSSILVCYLQGDASSIFMQAMPASFEEYMYKNNEEIKTFLKPLFLILHNNKNLKFRPINTHLLSDAGVLRFEKFIESFRKETRLEAFLENYHEFLLFLHGESLPIKVDKIFTSLPVLLSRIKDYRLNCKEQGALENVATLSDDDLANLTF